jgi:Zn-dependent protease
MRNPDIGMFVLSMIALIFSLSLHEFGHAWTSNYYGDDTARLLGRVSISPVTHVDPIGTLLFPAISFFTGAPLLGWARPVPVNPVRWRGSIRVANFWVSSAGVILNLAIAIVAGVLIRVMLEMGVVDFNGWRFVPGENASEVVGGLAEFLRVLFQLNIGLFVFNLLPIPPLDGGRILSSILPDSFAPTLDMLAQYGIFILYAALFTGVIGKVFGFVLPLAYSILFFGA